MTRTWLSIRRPSWSRIISWSRSSASGSWTAAIPGCHGLDGMLANPKPVNFVEAFALPEGIRNEADHHRGRAWGSFNLN